jgi:hypothetical protein
MPLFHIHLMQGRPVEFGRRIGEIVYQTMVEKLNIPQKDNFHTITEHTRNNLIYSIDYLNIQRTDGIVIIEITLSEGRDVNLKKGFYQRWQSAQQRLQIRKDIMITSLGKGNWSFGNGIAQYAP